MPKLGSGLDFPHKPPHPQSITRLHGTHLLRPYGPTPQPLPLPVPPPHCNYIDLLTSDRDTISSPSEILPCFLILQRPELHSETQPFIFLDPPSSWSFTLRGLAARPPPLPSCFIPYSLSLEYSTCLAQPGNNCFSFKTAFESCLIHEAFFQPLEADVWTSSSVFLRSLLHAAITAPILFFNCLCGCSPQPDRIPPQSSTGLGIPGAWHIRGVQ